jgi:transcriptional regulator with XRE-family HTH domain
VHSEESFILRVVMNASVEDLVNEVPSPPRDLMSSERRDLATARRWVEWVLLGVDRLNARFFVDPDASPLVREVVLQNAFLACVYSWLGRAEIGKASLVHAWIDSSSLVGLDTELFRSLRNHWVHAPAFNLNLTAQDAELLAIFNVAVAERFLAEGVAWRGRQIVRDLIVRLGLTKDEVAKMLRVPSETLDSWESGRTTIPMDTLSQLQAAGTALSKLLGIFQPERLPEVIRREADLFDGKPAVDWIVSGRITEVAERYERVLAYQA